MLEVRRHRWSLAAVAVFLQLTLSVDIGSAQLAGGGCDICGGEGSTIGKGAVIVQDPIAGDQVPCSEITNRSSQGFYNFLQCQIVQITVGKKCCTLIAPDAPGDANASTPPVVDDPTTTTTVKPTTVKPTTLGPTTDKPTTVKPTTFEPTTDKPTTVAPTTLPTSSPTSLPSLPSTSMPSAKPSDMPSDAPTQIPTEDDTATKVPNVTEATTTIPPTTIMPTMDDTNITTITVAPDENINAATPAPTTALPAVRGRVTVELRNVATEMSDSTARAFERQTTAFLQDQLSDSATSVRVTGTSLVNQFFAEARRNVRQRRRSLQSADTSLRPLNAIVGVSGGQQSPDSSVFSTLIADTISSNPDGYIAYLRNSTPPSNQLYFETVESATAIPFSRPADSTTEAPADPTADSGDKDAASPGLSVGAIVGKLSGEQDRCLFF